ncbi:hypothetical protein PI93_003700 [Pandoraea fibrosis]|uniref:MORN repeat-containing protein n=1 Tax=Pandoraea fibrosis TaxID=1891094 RepID=A0ABX6HNK3_9BURK|nr:hypothetical protein [Pandoraea fibrosis]QHE91019.1 hypothetical protein PJ20_003700 [Pandoraea fibrosis]QHF11850.1 hypothetical protein PI93_003700 [Pandoraea fibrosis]
MDDGRHFKRGAMFALSIAGVFGLLSCAPAHAAGWVKVADRDCKVWSNDPDSPGITWSATWVGPCKNGYADGPGVEEWFKNGVFDQRLEGELSQGKRAGVGTYTWASGNRYEGPFVNDERTGKGKFFWTNGDTYEGDFIAGKRTGKGIYVWASGKRYEGDILNDNITGQGYQLEPNGNTYRGQWADNAFDGPGVITFASDGSVRAGQFVKGKIYDGTDTRADGTLIATYANGVRSSATSSAASDDGPGVLSIVAGLLGAAAQGAASGGGRNAAQYQAVASALQATSGAAMSPSAMPQSVAPTSGNYNAGAGSNAAAAGRKTTAPISGCVEQVRIPRGAKGYVGWYEVETGVRNTCGYAINVAWCVTANNAADDSARCEKNYSGFYGLSPGEQLSLHADRFGTLQTLICKDPARPLNITWSGTRFTGQCVLL